MTRNGGKDQEAEERTSQRPREGMKDLLPPIIYSVYFPLPFPSASSRVLGCPTLSLPSRPPPAPDEGKGMNSRGVGGEGSEGEGAGVEGVDVSL